MGVLADGAVVLEDSLPRWVDRDGVVAAVCSITNAVPGPVETPAA